MTLRASASRGRTISIGVFYATREGQTRRVAERVVDALCERGFGAVAIDVRTLRPPGGPGLCSAAVVAASVHMGHHEPEMVRFVKAHRAELQAIPNAFLSVTLSEASAERRESTAEARARSHADVRAMTTRFIAETGWQPQRVLPVAGALRYTQYNPFVRMLMKLIARRAGASTDTSRDHEYTNWAALDRFVEEFAADLARRCNVEVDGFHADSRQASDAA
jgi:menaquinone-dependent protoporphyrinogen oxidase